MDGYAPEYKQLMEYGRKVVEGQDDPQYMFLREVRYFLQCAQTSATVVVEPLSVKVNSNSILDAW